jgi:hypothetical protein
MMSENDTDAGAESMDTNAIATQKKRLFTRIAFDTDAVLDVLSGKHACKLVDISLKGALVERPLPWHASIGEPCTLLVKLAEDGTAINMAGEVAHMEQGRLGIHCTEIDLESITSLRRLVELNLGDEAELHREISAMVHLDNTHPR